jgi:hypothetical protein
MIPPISVAQIVIVSLYRSFMIMALGVQLPGEQQSINIHKPRHTLATFQTFHELHTTYRTYDKLGASVSLDYRIPTYLASPGSFLGDNWVIVVASDSGGVYLTVEIVESTGKKLA